MEVVYKCPEMYGMSADSMGFPGMAYDLGAQQLRGFLVVDKIEGVFSDSVHKFLLIKSGGNYDRFDCQYPDKVRTIIQRAVAQCERVVDLDQIRSRIEVSHDERK